MANNFIGNQKGSGFTNIQKYLDANKGNVLGSSLSNRIGQSAGSIKSDLEDSFQDFQNEANSSNLNTDQNNQAVGNLAGKIQNIGSGQTLSDQDVGTYKSLSAGGYTGPNELSNIQGLKGRADEAGQINKSITDPNARFSLLKQYMGNPQYTYGQQRLDNLFLNNNKDLNAIRKTTSGLGGAIDAKASQAEALKSGVVSANKAFGQGTQQKIQDINTGLETGLNDQYNQALQKYNDLKTRVSGNQIDANLAKQLGLNYGQRIYDVNLGDYVNSNAPTLESTGTAQQRAQEAALTQLLGGNATSLLNPAGSQTYDPNKPLSLDASKLNTSIANRESSYKTALPAAQQNAVTRPDDPYQVQGMKNLQASGKFGNLSGFTLDSLYRQLLPAYQNGSLSPSGTATFQLVTAEMQKAKDAATQELNSKYQYDRTLGGSKPSGVAK